MTAGPRIEAAGEEVGAVALPAPRCHLGEGPVYDPVRDEAWWVDIVERRIHQYGLAHGVATCHTLPFMPSVIGWVDDARQMIAGDDGLHVRDVATGRLSLLVPLEADDPRTRSNDGRIHPSGALWIGTMGRAAEPGAGAIYHVLGSVVTRLYAGITIPNAICFNGDGSVGYFADTHEGILYRVPLDPSRGTPAGPPTALYDHRGGRGGLDGAVVDADGLIWNARWGAGCVDAYSPDGQRVRSVRVPATRPSCPAFVGPAFDRLLVTTASQGMDDAEKALDPQHGLTFILDVGAAGRPEPRFRLDAG